MTAVVTGNCEGCRFTECVTVCPVACFHGGESMVYVDPDNCIDCCACVAACPVQAIYMDADLPSELEMWIDLNRRYAGELPAIAGREDPLPTAALKRAELGF